MEEVYYFKASDKYTLVITKESESLIKKSIKDLTDEDVDSHDIIIYFHRLVDINKKRQSCLSH